MIPQTFWVLLLFYNLCSSNFLIAAETPAPFIPSLDLQNKARAEKNFEPMQWDNALSQSVKANLEIVNRDGGCTGLFHPPSPMTENLAQYNHGSGTEEQAATHGTTQWLEEKSIYNGGDAYFTNNANPTNYLKIGHYLNLMRAYNTLIGCATLKSAKCGRYLVGCHYSRGDKSGSGSPRRRPRAVPEPHNPSDKSGEKKPEPPAGMDARKKPEPPSSVYTAKKPKAPSDMDTTKKPEEPSDAYGAKKPEAPSDVDAAKKPEDPSKKPPDDKKCSAA